MKNWFVLVLVLFPLSLLTPAFAHSQEFSTMDTVYTPPGYTDGSGLATVYIPRIGNGIGVVLVHGCTGIRTNSQAWCDTLAAYGYVAMAIEYPDPCVETTATYPKVPRAVKLAVEFLRRNASRFGITTGKIAGFGMSNGAWIWGQAIISDNDDAYFQTDSTIDDHLNAAVLLYGSFDVYEGTPYYPYYYSNYFGGDSSRVLKGNCFKNVANITTPVLLLHGTSDTSNPYQQSARLHDSLIAHGKDCELVPFPGQPHGFDVNWSTLTEFTPAGLIAKDSALAFLRRELAPALKMHLYNRSIDFGNLEITESDTAFASLTNIGVGPLTVTSISKSTPQFAFVNPPTFPAIVPAGNSLQFGVAFHPNVSGVLRDTIEIASDDSLYPLAAISVHGKGVVMSPATAGVLYSASGEASGGSLYSLNTSIGSVDAIGALGTTEIDGLAIRHSDHVIFGSHPTSTSTTLYRISSSSGDAVRKVVIPLGNLRAIAFSPGDTLYGATTTGTLYRIELSDGHVDSIGTMKGLGYYGLAFRPHSNQLWASVRYPIDSIYQLNTTTGVATFIGVTGFNSLTYSIAFDHLGNLLGLIDDGSGADYLASIDTNNASGTILAGPLPTGNLQSIAIRDDQGTTSVNPGEEFKIPKSYGLSQNYPNPFNPVTTISYALPKAEHVKLSVFNMLGEEVATLVNEAQGAGYKSVSFDGSRYPSGMYIYRISAGNFSDQKKLLLIK